MFKNTARDRYSGITVSLQEDVCRKTEVEKFSVELEEAVQGWREGGVRGVWLRIPVGGAHLIECAVEVGFGYHHAKRGYLMLTMWLGEGENRLPEQAHHQAGVGGVVLSADGTKVLAIREKTGVTAGMKTFWKFPGGMVDSGEDLKDAAVREIFEETGIRTIFRVISGFRETHQAPFSNTDFYFVCVLCLDPAHYPDLADNPTPTPKPCELEVADAQWMPTEEFLALPFYRKGLYASLIRTGVETATRCHGGDFSGLEQVSLPSLRNRVESLYKAVDAKL